jgi:MFS family permease
MLVSVVTMMVAVAVLAAWKDLPGLLIGRVITGVSVGLAAGTAITYLIELRLRADPAASHRKPALRQRARRRRFGLGTARAAKGSAVTASSVDKASR